MATIAGYVNVVMLSFFAVPVSHMSGAVSHLGINLAAVELADVMLAAAIVAGFFLGALLSGLVLRDTQFKMKRRYGFLLILESGLLTLTMFLALRGANATVPLAAMACGLQNAMASSYRGLTLRTTHVTGIVTDLGALLGNRIRGRQISSWKFGLLFSVLVAFFLGGLAGAMVLVFLQMWALSLVALLCLILGLLVLMVSS
ncbi:YoaK family protein [Pseudohongiella spirulinae]|uniref:YoaK family protein n=1 Tax=Pseudohongiella spirulinae TaxID=1249552 RepID=UPI003AB0C1AB